MGIFGVHHPLQRKISLFFRIKRCITIFSFTFAVNLRLLGPLGHFLDGITCKYVLCQRFAKLAAMYMYVPVGREGRMCDTEYITLPFQPAIMVRQRVPPTSCHLILQSRSNTEFRRTKPKISPDLHAPRPNLRSKNLRTPMTLKASTSIRVGCSPARPVDRCGTHVFSSLLA